VKDVSDQLREAVRSGQMSDAEIEQRVEGIKASRSGRDFKKSDALRDELTAAGIVVEISKDGIRWRRK
jgi:cysteinyl-tRNA synthetase